MEEPTVAPENREALYEAYAFLIQCSMERKAVAQVKASKSPASSPSPDQGQVKTEQ